MAVTNITSVITEYQPPEYKLEYANIPTRIPTNRVENSAMNINSWILSSNTQGPVCLLT